MMNDKDYEIAELLQKLGETRPTARILTLLRDGKERKSIDIEREAALRQPEVSISMKELLMRLWVVVKNEPQKGKGRPTRVYKLVPTLDMVIKYHELNQEDSIVLYKTNISKLREMVRA